ncbi:MAG: GAF domain-containing protein [Candidatus Puniceispirillaceae bacterium]
MNTQRDTLPLEEVRDRILALCDGERDEIALMASIACELYQHIDGYDWVGFYRVTAPDMLKIGPYQGGHGCLQIPFDKGVCGACARTNETQLVDDVEAFPGHIACSSSTRSELVVPVHNRDGNLIAVLDIDSDMPARFTHLDREFAENLMAEIFASQK